MTPSFSGRFVEVKRDTKTRRRKLVPKGRVLLVLDDVIEIDGVGFVPVIHHGRLEYVKTEDIQLIGRVASKKTASKKKTTSKKKASRKSGKRVVR